MALESYNPKLIEAWRLGALKQIEITLPTRAAATKLRQKLYRLRQELIKAQHSISVSAQRAQIRILGPDAENNYTLIIEPEGKEYDDALTAAGLDIPDISDTFI